MAGWSEGTRLVITTLLLTPLLLIFGEFVPKQIFRLHSDSLMPRLSLLIWLWRLVCWLPVTIIAIITKPLVRRDLDFICHTHRDRHYDIS